MNISGTLFLRTGLLVLIIACFPVVLHAEPLLDISADFPAEHKAEFKKERAALLVEKKSLNGKIRRSNARCVNEKKKSDPALAHKCSVDRTTLFSESDQYNAKVMDFNKRVQALGK